MRLIAATLALLCLLLPAPAAPKFPALTGRVVDDANILTPQTKADLDQKLAALEQNTSRQLVVVISDVTAEVRRDRADRLQRDVMAAVARLLPDRPGFISFLDEARRLVARICNGDYPPVPEGDKPRELMRDLHTLKGNCGIFGLRGIAAVCHELEDRVTESGQPLDEDQQNALRAAFSALETKLAPFLGEGQRDVTISVEEHAEFLAAVDARTAPDVFSRCGRAAAPEPERGAGEEEEGDRTTQESSRLQAE
jgi:HPt (histidine-containing phosphotransfer) domain-containing protein